MKLHRLPPLKIQVSYKRYIEICQEIHNKLLGRIKN